MIALVVTGIVSAFLLPAVYRDRLRKVTLRMYREGQNLALLKPITLRIDRDSLVTEAASGSGTVRWEYIERVAATADHLFIYTNALNAIIVPKAGVISGIFDAFADTVQKRWQEAVAAGNPNATAPA